MLFSKILIFRSASAWRAGRVWARHAVPAVADRRPHPLPARAAQPQEGLAHEAGKSYISFLREAAKKVVFNGCAIKGGGVVKSLPLWKKTV